MKNEIIRKEEELKQLNKEIKNLEDKSIEIKLKKLNDRKEELESEIYDLKTPRKGKVYGDPMVILD